MNANIQPFQEVLDDIGAFGRTTSRPEHSAITVSVTDCIEDVEQVWRQMSVGKAESPAQSYDFIRLWVRNRGIARNAQRYVVGEVDGRPVALLPLHLKRARGIRVFTWFPGANVGAYAPVADYDRLAALGVEGRAALWRAMTGRLRGADLVYLRSLPSEAGGHGGLFDEVGSRLSTETLYRAEFSSWEQCDREQRSRSRRKHDRQQGDRLAAMGDVRFEELRDSAAAHEAVATMFRQRSARFKAQGIADCFVAEKLHSFYHDAIDPDSGVDVRVHVLRLNDETVAVRYNIVQGDRMFCLISSMSEAADIQAGSPGKQCLLRVMQSVFDDGYSTFDMGAGFTDEKRHWCNVQVALGHHYVPLTHLGLLVVAGHRAFQRLRAYAKARPSLKSALRSLRQFGQRPQSEQL